MTWFDLLARWTLPALLGAVPLIGLLRGVDVFSAFIEGAKEGMRLAATILPYLVAIFVAIGIFRASGALELVTHAIGPLLRLLGIPGEVLPLMIVRPLSGNGSLALALEIIAKWGPDSTMGRMAAVIQGSTDTTLYVLSLYFGSVGIVRTRHALAAGLAADAAGFLAAVMAVRWYFPD